MALRQKKKGFIRKISAAVLAAALAAGAPGQGTAAVFGADPAAAQKASGSAPYVRTTEAGAGSGAMQYVSAAESQASSGSSRSGSAAEEKRASDVVLVGDGSALQLYYAVEETESLREGVRDPEPSCSWIADADATSRWLEKTGLPAAAEELGQGSRLVIFLGSRELKTGESGAAEKYLKVLKSRASGWEKQGVAVYFVSALPGSMSQTASDEEIETFNTAMREGLPESIHYLNLYDSVKARMGSESGWRGALGREIYLELMDEVTADYARIYDYDYYRSHHADVLGESADNEEACFNHFLAEGMRDGLQAKDDFDVASYRARYPELASECGDDLAAWYMEYATEGYSAGRDGSKEVSLVVDGRDYSAVYDYDFYRAKYPSLQKKYGNDRAAFFNDFINEGMAAGRQGSSGFDPAYYRSGHPELAASLGDDTAAYYRAYIDSGSREGGSATGYLTAVTRLADYSSGQYDFTTSAQEAMYLAANGWENEGIAWYAPTSSAQPVWKTRNESTGRTSFFTDEGKYRQAVQAGETDLGTAFYADDTKRVPVYHLTSADGTSDLYTIDEDEYNSSLVDGWADGGIAWYASATVAATVTTSVGIYSDGADYSIEATVNMTGSGSGFIAKVDMLSGSSGEAFDFVYDTGWKRNAEQTYFYLENIMSHSAEPGLRGKDYTYISSPVGKVGQSITLRLSWYASEGMLRAFVNGNQVAETATTNGVPEAFALEAGGKYAGDAVNAVFTNVRVKKNGVVTAYTVLDSSTCRAENYNGYSAGADGRSVVISGAAAVPAGTNWDTSIAITGHALGAYCILK